MRAYVYLILFLVLPGCSAVHQPDSASGDFSTRSLAEDTHEVVFEGDYATPQSVAVEFTLLRAAELAKASGFSHFQILTADANRETLTITRPAFIRSIQGSSVNYHTWVDLSDEDVKKHERPHVVMVVKFLADTGSGKYVFPVDEVIAELRSKYDVNDHN